MKTGQRFMKAQKSAGPQSATHTLMVKSSLSRARSVNARWCRAQHAAPTASVAKHLMPDTMGTLSSLEEPAFCAREPSKRRL